jgi:hypothetical protein
MATRDVTKMGIVQLIAYLKLIKESIPNGESPEYGFFIWEAGGWGVVEAGALGDNIECHCKKLRQPP